MKITLTYGAGPTTATLADIGAAPQIAAMIEDLGGDAVVQIEDLYAGPNKAKFPRGNVGGQFVFTAACSFATADLALAALLAAYALLNIQGALNLKPFPASTGVTFPNAILKSIRRVRLDGVILIVRYTFEITTITSP